jgi:hypothetical protein
LYGILRTRRRRLIERPAKPHAARPAAETFLAAEELESRLLLSGEAASALLGAVFAPQYIIYNPNGGDSGVSTQGDDAIASEFSPLGSASRVGLTPQQIRSAYGIDSIVVGSLIGDGTGQTIVIVVAYDNPAFVSSSDPNYVNSDLYKFNQYFGLPDFGGPGQPTFTKLDQNGGTSYPAADTTGWSTEIALDVEWAHVIAPKANIVLIEANSAYDVDLVWTAVNTARNLPGASVVSMSFGSSEGSEDLSENSVFLTPVGHAGVTFLAASGDNGSPGLYPAYSPNVVAVGGTTLTLSGNNYVSETAWSGSGGGQSVLELAPVYQDGVQGSAKRQMPDVAFDANPNSGVAVYDSYGEGAATPWVQVGGTSLSAPCWAGLIAIVNQIRASQGLGPLDGQSQTLPGIYSLQAAGLHDITSGGNGGFLAGPGYDMVTGRGSPVANILVPALAATNIPEPVVFYSANMDTNPLWTYQDQWAWGQPTGGSGNRGGPDPTSGHTGANVVGYNLSGGYSRINTTQYVTTSAVNCSGRTGVTLSFWRWLGVDSSSSDHASVQVSNNGSTWTTVFQNPSITINETAWSYQTYDISAVADNQAAVYIRWGMGTTNRQGNYCGWNIDDVTLSQTAGFSTGPRVTDPNISITSSPSGALGTYRIGDVVTAQWNNTAGGDGNTGALAAANPVTMDFSQFGGPAAVAATNNSGIWTASYTIVAGPIDDTNRNVSVRVTDLAGNVTTAADTTNLSVDNQAPTAGMAAVTPDPRTSAVSQIAITFSEPVGGFGLSDLELTRSGGGDLLTASQTLDTSDNVTWLLGGLSDVTGTPGLYVLSLAAGVSGIVDDAGNPLAGDASQEWLFNSTVAGRFVFYNGSALDGNDPSPNANDDAAIATDKQALLPGQQATSANVTSFSGGINGIMVDVTGLADPADLTVANIGDYFVFKAGNDSDPTAWDLAAAPSGVLVRQGAGVGGADRVEIVWADGAIRNRWLQVRILSQANGGGAGLADDDVFYFGNLTGDANGDAVVDAADYMALKMALRTGAASGAGSADFNESGTVDYGDLGAAVGSFGQSIDMAFSAPQQIAQAAPAMSAMTAAAPEAAAADPATAAESEPAAPLAADPATVTVMVTTSATMADSPAAPPAASSTLQDAAAVLDALAASYPSPLAATATTARPTCAEPPTPPARQAEPLSTFLLPPRSPGKAGQEALADALALAWPWRTNDSAGHDSPDEPWTASLILNIAGKPRKGLLDPIGLDLLAASR